MPFQKFIRDLKDRIGTEGTFFFNAFWTFSGRGLGILIGLLLTPIITRIYSPSDYGEFAFLNALLGNLALAGSMKWPIAFVIPKKEEEFHRLLRAVLLLTVFVAAFLSILALGVQFINEGRSLENVLPTGWHFFIGPGVLLYVLWEVMNNWRTRTGEFRKGAFIGFSFNLSTRGISILSGLGLGASGMGLIHGELGGRLLGVFLYLRWLFWSKLSFVLRGLSLADISFAFKNYGSYPRYILPANWMNQLSAQSPIFIFPFLASTDQVGLYSLAIGLLNLPFRFFAGSLVSVVTKKVADLKHREEEGRLLKSLHRLCNTLVLTGALPAFCVLYFGELGFSFLFGDEWRQAGLFAGIVVWSVWSRIISTSLSSVYRVYRKENLVFFFNLSLAILRGIGIAIGIWNGSFILAIILFCVGNLLVYWSQIIYVHYFIHPRGLKFPFLNLFIFLATLGGSILIYMS